MKRSSFKGLVVAVAFSITLFSCGKKTDLTAEEAGRNLAGNTSPEILVSLEAKSLLDKSGMADGDVMPMAFKILFSEMMDYFTKEEKTGIGFDGKSLIMVKLKEKELDFGGAVFNVKDLERFNNMIKEELKTEILEKDGYSYVISPDNDMAIGWYKTFGVMLGFDKSKASKESCDAKLQDVMKKCIEAPEKTGDLYTEFFDTKGDIVALYDMGAFTRIAQMEGGLREEDKQVMDKMNEYYNGSFVIYSASFETDKIVADIKTKLSDKADKKVKEIMGKGVSGDFMNYLTNDKVIGFMTGSFFPKPTYSFAEEMGGEEFQREMEQTEKYSGFKVLDVISSFSGDFSLALIDVKEQEITSSYIDENGKEESYSYTTSMPVITFTAGISNDLVKSMFDTLQGVTKNEAGYLDLEDTYITFTDKVMFVTTSEELAADFTKNGKLSTYSNSTSSKATENPVYGYFDFQSLLAIMPEKEREQVVGVIGNMQYAVAYGNQNSMHFELIMDKTGKNSLYNITKGVVDAFFSVGMPF